MSSMESPDRLEEVSFFILVGSVCFFGGLSGLVIRGCRLCWKNTFVIICMGVHVWIGK